MKTLTWDRGLEMRNHTRISVATDLDIYFCDPAKPWQRGSNENTTRLLRQYFPKATDLSDTLDLVRSGGCCLDRLDPPTPSPPRRGDETA